MAIKNIYDLEKNMTPQAKPKTIPGKIIDYAVSGLAPTGIALVNTAASYHPNFNSLGEMFEQGTVTPSSSSSSTPSSSSPPEVTITPTVRAMNENEQAMAKQELRQRKTVAKGGRVSYKSVFDMER